MTQIKPKPYKPDKERRGESALHNQDDELRNTFQEYLSGIDKYVELCQAQLWELNKYIHDNPELAFQEHKAHDALTTFMKSQKGWEVKLSAYGLETAWIATFNSGKHGPVVSFNAEMGMSKLSSTPKIRLSH
jgi:hypothetical protein